MGKGRLEAFSDGVLAIVITIMALELKAPNGPGLADLAPLYPVFLSYVLSFVYIAIYWNNHHHMFQTVSHVTGQVLWANAHLLFWLSLVPFATAWMGANHFGAVPTAIYGFALLMCGVAYWILQHAIIAAQGPRSLLRDAIGRDLKGRASPIIYVLAIASCALEPMLALALYVGVALIWLVPDRRIEKALSDDSRKPS